jgi:argininosuccinate synthase
MKKVVLAYSGGLDTSVAVAWLREKYDCEVVCLTVDVGGGSLRDGVEERAISAGASRAYVVDARDRFVRDFVWPHLQANALYQDAYPLATALARPLIAQLLVEVARREDADAVAHGCTGKGNDQVRFDVSVQALDPDLKIIAPVREWSWSRWTSSTGARRSPSIATGMPPSNSIVSSIGSGVSDAATVHSYASGGGVTHGSSRMPVSHERPQRLTSME